MDDTRTALVDADDATIDAEIETLGEIAHQLYLALIHLRCAKLSRYRQHYRRTYTVNSRHLREAEDGISVSGSGQTLEAALRACIEAHERMNGSESDYPVAWYATLTVARGHWKRTIAINPLRYQHLVPGGQFDSGFKGPDGKPILALAS